MSPRALNLGLILAATIVVAGDTGVCTDHTYLGNNPDEGNPGWHEEVQGLAHDADFWYVTQNPGFFPFPGSPLLGGPQLWRIPVTHDLGDGVDCGHGSVSCSALRNTPLLAHDYNHYGDPDVYEVGGRAYVLVPIENGDAGPGVALFRADATLEFLAFAPFPAQTHAGWVAAGSDGMLLSSEGESVTRFNRFFVDWAAFQASGEHTLTLEPRAAVLLRDEANAPLELLGAQGGEYSDDGQVLYFSNGYGDLAEASWGVHVFETRPGSGAECAGTGDPCVIARRVERSHNGAGGFAYEFNTSNLEEPEGLTFWDLDADGRAPGLRGQLHVVLLDNDVLTDDDAYVKHYRLSFDDIVPPSIICPLDTVAECSAHTGVPALDPQLAPFLAGASAIDQCDSSPSLTNNAPGFFNLGPTHVTFTATDRSLNASSCMARVTVADTTPPSLLCPAPAVVECTGPHGVGAADPQLAGFFSGASAADVCDAAPILSNDAPELLPIGTTPVAFTARDGSGNLQSCGTSVRVADTVPPRLSIAPSAATLWPPNHKLVPVTVAISVSDRCDSAVSFELVSITSNEPDNGLGDGDTTGDIQGAEPGTADTSFLLRAERSGSGAGRTYRIEYRAVDAAGNASEATAFVRVPHNR